MKKKPLETKKEAANVQLDLGLKSPFVNVFHTLKGRIKSRLNLFEANTFINDPLIWFFVSFQLIALLYQAIYILNSLPVLPSVLPLFGYTLLAQSTLLPKLYFLLFPLVSFVLVSTTFKIAQFNYFKNELLAYYTLFLSTLVITTFALHILKILSQYV